jgi:hypothetical protein
MEDRNLNPHNQIRGNRQSKRNRFCCNSTPVFKILYFGGSMGNDEIFVCAYHIDKHPFDKQIISKEEIQN